MVTKFGFEDGKILDHIKTAKTNISKELEKSPGCFAFAPQKIIEKNNEFLSQQLNSTDDRSFVKIDLSEENINRAAKMFLNLNACYKKADNLKEYFKNLYYLGMWEFKGTYAPMPRPLKQVILSSWKIFHDTSTGDNKTIAKTFLDRLNTILKLDDYPPKKDSETESNHPVHIFKRDGNLSQSAFIPFCSFGEDMTVMGVRHKLFHSPVCNSFEAVIHQDQLCYQVDLEKYKDEKRIKRQLQHGLVLLLDYNEERDKSRNFTKKPKEHNIFSPDTDIGSQIYLDTISKIADMNFELNFFFRPSNVVW